MKPCRYCGREYEDGGVLAHEPFCKLNPNPNPRIICCCLNCGRELAKHNIKKHIEACNRPPKMLICPECGIEFEEKEGVTCSYSCANKYFRKGTRRATDEELTNKGRYRELCFRYHDKRCVVCGEDKIVAVHHFNNDHLDHRPENLVPVCPTHHKYLHSGYKNLVFPMIVVYVESFVQKTKRKLNYRGVTK